MRVGHLRSSEFFGGPERGILGQCRNMVGPSFTCLSFIRGDGGNAFLDRCRQHGVEAMGIPEAGVGDFRVVGRIRRLAKELKLDVLVSHDYKSNLMGILALKGTPVRHIRHFRGYTWESRKVLFYNWIDRQCMRRMPVVLAVSARSAEILAGDGVPPNIITVVPNAIEGEKLVAADLQRSIAGDRPFRLVAAGRLSLEKGYDVLVRALAMVPPAKKLVVDVYGEGPELQRLETMVGELGIGDRITFKGFVDDVLPRLRTADAMVLPSRSEGMPNILLEAWSQKTAVISTAVGGVPEMIHHDGLGLVCPPENPEAMAEKLSWACENHDALLAMGEAGYREVQARYTYAVQSAMLMDIYTGKAGG